MGTLQYPNLYFIKKYIFFLLNGSLNYVSKNLLPFKYKLYCNKVKLGVIKQRSYGEDIMENAQLSGGAMLVLGIIIAIVIVLIPAFIYIYAWIAAILLIIGGLVSLLTGG